MSKILNNISVIGGGAWGTALAQMLAVAGRNVTLYAREEELIAHINEARENKLYLPDVSLHKGITATSDPETAVKDAQLVLLVSPAQYVRPTIEMFKKFFPDHVPLINCAKGIEISTGQMILEIVQEIAPGHPYAALSGPAFAGESARGLPTAVTFATTASDEEAQLWAESIRGQTLRPYLSSDPVGTEIGGALKNVIAVACGIVEGRKLGQNARAAVMTRGMAEIKRFGLMKGALADTFLGLSGLGDLTLTCNSMASRNFSLGRALGEGQTLEEIMSQRNSVAEGVSTAKAIAKHAMKTNTDMPICVAVDHILHGDGDISEVIAELLSRDLKRESA